MPSQVVSLRRAVIHTLTGHTKDSNPSPTLEHETIGSPPIEQQSSMTDFPKTFKEKVALAKELLRTNKLHPTILKGIRLDNDDSFLRSHGDTLPISARELATLLDRGVIGKGTTPGYISRFDYTGNEPPIPGLDTQLNKTKLSKYVSQGTICFSADTLLCSEGFSSCHAVIIYDHTTSQAALLHTVYWDADPGQVERLKDLWPHKGKRELIYVYGTGSRKDSDCYMVKAAGATDFRTIQVATGCNHWAIAYDPKRNEVQIARKCVPEVLVYPGFSKEVYDSKLRETNSLEKRLARVVLDALDRLAWLGEFNKLNGVFTTKDLGALTNRVSSLIKKPIEPYYLRDFLLSSGVAFEDKAKLVIPALFADIEEDRKDELTGIYERFPQLASIRCVDTDEFYAFYRRLVASFGKHLWGWDRWSAIARRDGEELGLMGSGSEIKFRGDVRSKLYYDALVEAEKIRKQLGYRTYFDSPLGYSSDKIVPPSKSAIESWEELVYE